LNTIEFVEKSLDENSKYIYSAVKGLSQQELSFRVKPFSNSIAFLLWHLARVEDLWINRNILGEKELYDSYGWFEKFGTSAQDNGFGFDVKKLDAWPVPKLELIQSYAAAVRGKTQAYLKTVVELDLDEAKDFRWSKGTTGTALSHLICEIGEHAGQIGYIRGIMRGIEPPGPPPER
jgi:uncharacterized damage-inducible protein DinB